VKEDLTEVENFQGSRRIAFKIFFKLITLLRDHHMYILSYLVIV